ncbi:MAG: ParB/RepB/Spo0J family partition protein [Crocinitomicaceae bacterium]|jgi:ParB family chromosome partitioning protein
MSVKKGGLGKGLSALLQDSKTDITTKNNNPLGSINMLAIESIEVNPFNPRTHFEEDALNELCESIAQHGIIQPLTVRKLGNDKYQLISGERRFRASQLAGLKEVPAYVRVANDQTMLEMALVENIQREDLNAIEVALSYARLIEECNLTQEEMSKKIAKSRSSITNHLRLLKLPALIQKGVRDKKISMGHARALVSVNEEARQIEIYNKIIENELSVRDVEHLIKDNNSSDNYIKSTAPVKKKPLSETQKTFCYFLGDKISSKVDVKKANNGNGQIIIHFDSEVDLNRIIEILNK